LHIITAGSVLAWLLRHFSYHTVIVLKNTATDLSAFVLGLIVATFLAVVITKDSRIVVDPETDDVTITKMKKNGATKTFINVPSGKISPITGIVAYLHLIFIRLTNKKSLHFVDSRRVRITWAILLIFVVAVCLFNITMDSHVVLPTAHNGEFKVYDLKVYVNK
jgi:hypothetical protein